jgi:hypothetical protein
VKLVTRESFRSKVERRDYDNDQKIFDLWLDCYTQEEMATVVECDQKTVGNLVDGFRNSVLENQTPKAIAEQATDFALPLAPAK